MPIPAMQMLQASTSTVSSDPWGFYRAITVDNTGGAAKTNWPVRVALTSSNFTFAHALSTGYDIQFRASNGTTVLSSWREAFDSSGQTAAFWVLVPSVGAGATVTIRAYTSNAAAADASNGDPVFPTLFEDFAVPERMTAALETLSNPQVGNWNRYGTICVAGTSWRTDDLAENSRIIYDPTDAVNPYKCYVTGKQGSAYRIGLFVSSNGTTWTEYVSNPISTIDMDDMCFVRSGSTIHAFVEFPGTPGASNIVVKRLTSTDDGLSWSDQGTVIPKGTVGAWDDDRAGSPCVLPIPAGGFVMIYDGAGTGGGAGQEIGAATASTLGGTWTKVAGNPLLNTGASSVPTDFWQDAGGTWWLTTWAAEVISLYTCTVADPTTWVAGSWTLAKANFVGIEGTLALAENTGRTAGVASRIGNTAAADLVRRVDFLGTSTVTFDRAGLTALEPWSDVIEVHDSELQLDPRGSNTSHAQTVRWTRALVNDWALGFRFKKTAQTNGSFARISVGSGASTAVGGNNHIQQPANSYGLVMGLEAGANTSLNSVVTGTETTQGAAFTLSDFANYHRFELTHTGTTLGFTKDGGSAQSRTVSAHDAASKDVMLCQGRSSSSLGAISFYDWIYARPYDGVDPAVTVGSEVAT